MRIRSLIAATIVAGLVLPAVPAMAANKPVVIKDTVGDANAVNDQELLGAPAPSFPGNISTAPASYSAMDITQVTLVTQFVTKRQGRRKVQVPTALVVTLQFAAPPQGPGGNYGITATPPGTCSLFLIEYREWADGATSSEIRTCSDVPLETLDIAIPSPKISGNKMIWVIPMTMLAKFPTPLKPGAVLANIGASSSAALGSGASGGLLVPVVDQVDSTLKYVVGK